MSYGMGIKEVERMKDTGKECKFNLGVICDSEKCEKCGWNPEVDKKRKAEKGAKK